MSIQVAIPAANYRNQTQVSTALQITVAETPYVYHERTLPNPPPSTLQDYLLILYEVPHPYQVKQLS
jgi:hypothetical protein